jgi:SAM-dependent methyltransferase
MIFAGWIHLRGRAIFSPKRLMYSIAGYGKMIADRGRMDAYRAALRRVIRSDSVVLDIGCGTAIFSLLACQLGARRVYAVEPDDAIQVGREIAAANGYRERIVFIQDRSDRVNLPERADVIVSDLRGILPLFGHHLSSIIDARRRWLAPDGVMIPQSDTLWAAVVQAPELYSRYFGGLDGDSYELKMDAARTIVANSWSKARVEAQQLVVEPQCWATLDYRTVRDINAGGELTWITTRSGTASGLIVWFDSTLIEGVGISNAPTAPELIYGSAFFPLLKPVEIDAGDQIAVAFTARLIGEDYLWGWETTVSAMGAEPCVKAHFKQSTFLGAPLSPISLRARQENFVPELDEGGAIDHFILSSFDGAHSLGDIARAVMARFPDHFADRQSALRRVSELSQRYSRRPEVEK